MSNALQDQLLKAGLIDSKQVKKVNHDKNKKKRQQKLKKNKKNKVKEESTVLAEKAAQEKISRDKALNLEKEDIAKQKAILAQIRQLINMNRLSKDVGENAYNFTHNNTVKRLYVTPKIMDQLSRGLVAIVYSNDVYDVVPAQVAEKIKLRDTSLIIVLNDKDAEQGEDDEYAEYQIPDDLMW